MSLRKTKRWPESGFSGASIRSCANSAGGLIFFLGQAVESLAWESSMSTDAHARDPVKSSIAPMLSVRAGARAVAFYKSAFGALEEYRVEDPGGAVVCRLSVDGAEFWVADESPEHGN